MGKVLYKVFKTVVKEISQYLPPLGESGSEVSHFIPEPRNFAEVTKFSDVMLHWYCKFSVQDSLHCVKILLITTYYFTITVDN